MMIARCPSLSSAVRPLLAGLGLLAMQPASALEFDLPADGDTVVGELRLISTTPDNTLHDLARFYDIGYLDITLANPRVNEWTPGNALIVLPTQYILPSKPWRGIVLNIPQRRLYYFPPVKRGEPAKVHTFPVSISREGWSTPLGQTRIVAKHKDPGWVVPQSIKAEHEASSGTPFPDYFPPGPDNPMGMLALQTGFKSIFIHGTNKPWGVGMRLSHGCLHLYPEDAETMFSMVPAGTPVRIVNQPVVAGVKDGAPLLAVYPAVSEYAETPAAIDSARAALQAVISRQHKGATGQVDWALVKRLVKQPTSIPTPVQPDAPLLADRLLMLDLEHHTHPPYGADANDARVPERPDEAQREPRASTR